MEKLIENKVISIEFLAKQIVEGFITGLHRSPFHGFSVEFLEHKIYNLGDNTKYIDWKLYAKTDKLFTKRFQEETNLRCYLVLDVSSSMFFPDTKNNKLSYSIYSIASIIELLKRQRDAFGLSIFSDNIEFLSVAKSTDAHKYFIYQKLEAILNSVSKNKISNIVKSLHDIAEQIHKRSMVIIFSDMIDNNKNLEDVFGALQHLKYNKHEVVLFDVYDSEVECEFLLENKPHNIIDSETGVNIKVNPFDIRDVYTNAYKQHKKELKMKCLQYGIDYVNADIRKGYNNILNSFLLKRNKLQ